MNLSYKRLNNLTGWAVFLVALVTYILTVEPTASFWDCGEFIACSYKLQVPHPPGAPMFLLINRIFSMLALGDVYKVAYWVNISSVLAAAFSILFLFWSITLLARKIVLTDLKAEPSLPQILAILGSGAVGALAYTFSDSFWFSAVEAEVYAMSSFFTAIVFWCMLKWEAVADEDGADKWLLLIAYLVGLSIGVHLLNLVTIPALGLIYYFKRYKPGFKGFVISMLASLAILGVIQVGIIPGLPTYAGKFEVLFVNNFHLPFGSGIIFFSILIIGGLVWGIIYSQINNKVLLNTGLLGLAFVLIGYGCYAMIVIRSNFNPPIDENNPEDIMNVVSYLKREQYGDRPILYGPSYTGELIDQEQGEALYRKGKEKYEIYDYKVENKFDPKHNILFPRMHSRQPGHAQEYARWTGRAAGKKPTMSDNLTFFFKYQLGHMYWRYFLWNFSGREGDDQDMGWLRAWDTADALPESLAKSKARNNFFMLPLILGLLGVVFHYGKSKKDFMVMLFLFVLTGIALVVYLNPPPTEPRERDYIYVGSFYAFAIWIGLGVLAVMDYMKTLVKKEVYLPIISTLLCLTVPTVMAAQGWNDHNRSNRYHSVDSAKNLLNSCAPNAVLFTGGDNDTFPLWYVQEVEGFRTDVRVCNLSLLNTDWYVQQMKMQAYDSKPLPISLEFENFIQGKNDYLPFVENPQGKNGISLPVYINLVKENHPAITVQASSGSSLCTLPSEYLILPIDTDKVRNMDYIPKGKESLIPAEIKWRIGRGALEKKDLIMLDMIATGNWERPLYFSTTLSNSNYLGLREYMQMEGLAYRLMPFKVDGATQGFVNTDVMYDRMMKGMYWRGLDDENCYYDENYKRFPLNARLSFYRLAAELLAEGKPDKAKEVVYHCLKVIPDKSIPYDVYSPSFIGILLRTGDSAKAFEIADIMRKRAEDELKYYYKNDIQNEMAVQTNLYIVNQIMMVLKTEGLDDKAKAYDDILRQYLGDNY
ncbi:MAG: DUF2723 domain-containing protein [Cytophagales bacterium]|nr:DUF2723 domain-containing protein [Cytophagales bacterium]